MLCLRVLQLDHAVLSAAAASTGAPAAADPNDRLKLVTARVVGSQGSRLSVEHQQRAALQDYSHLIISDRYECVCRSGEH